MPTTLDAARAQLRTSFGFADFKPGQADILEAVLEGRDVLAVMPTGAGKSLCYQLPALMRSGVTVVVSPLIALMQDQVGKLTSLGIAAGALNSGNSGADNARVEDAIRRGTMSLVYVAPERLARSDTQRLLESADVTLLAVDEAHCVSQWGHDFRPEYMGLRETAARIGARQIVALTATADPPTRDEIVARLFDRPPAIFVRSFDRPNIRLAMARKNNAPRQIAALVARNAGASGIVYCASRKGAGQFAERLRALGHNALAYHAGMDSFDRARHQAQFQREPGIVMVATIAFGMGIDKADVRFVAHADLPGSIESYYQEIGRAGRDGLPADTLTLYGDDDIMLRRRQIEHGDAPLDRKRLETRKLDALLALCETPRCRRQTLLAAFGERAGRCNHCDICEGRHAMFDGTIAAQKALSSILRTQGRFFAGHLANLLAGKATEAMRRHAHDALKTFGVGQEFSPAEWRGIFRQLEACELIARDEEDHSRWFVTDAGRAVLSGQTSIELRDAHMHQSRRALHALREIDADAAPLRSPTQPSGIAATLSVRDARLLKALRVLRLECARTAGKPAFTVFHDATLLEMATTRPADAQAFLGVRGVGEAKARLYGPRFLEAITRDGVA